MPVAEGEESHNLGNGLQLPRSYGPPRLLAIARDPWTIFAYWNVDWPSIFKNAAPIDRQVHLRIHCADGLEEKEAAVEPMAAMHYITMSQRHRICRIEIGYYQPADVWHSVAMSNEIVMLPADISDAEHVDLATIPFHLSFQQLLDLFGVANESALATAMSQFQKSALSSGEQKALSPEKKKTFRKLGISISELGAAWRVFNETDSDKLARRRRALLGFTSTSPSRGFAGEWTLAGS